MTVLIDTDFTVGADTELSAFNSTFVKRAGGADQITVRASDDVCIASALSVDIMYIYDSTAMAKTQITATILGTTNDVTSYPSLILRGTRSGNFNCYAVEFEDSPGGDGEVGVYRVINGAFTSLSDVRATTGSLPHNSLTTVIVDIDDSGGNPVIGVKVGGGTRATVTDSNAAKITGTGHGGLYFFDQGDVNNARISSLKIENLDVVDGQPTGSRRSGVPGTRIGGPFFGRGW